MTWPAIGAAMGPFLLAASGVLLSAGCGALPGGPAAAPAVPAADARFDGVYAGRNVAVSGWGFLCGPPTFEQTIVVSGGGFDYPYLVSAPRTTPVPVQVAADGTFRGSIQYGTEDFGPRSRYINAWVTVAGRIAGDDLDATVSDLRCVRHLTARRG
jgi:hypothetical protein